ncbi:MAG: diphosphate--fructose-6-phosphate 1-phosphotransferase [Oligosphaeraceae bacterium]|nr:diphosphate--fructose-6-phosphate 1-phosphotransferase [Oligosphaeraceae bacterium]
MISALQQARYTYIPKLPAVLSQSGPFVGLKVGAATQSVDNQDEIKAIFPDTYGLPTLEFVTGKKKNLPAVKVGVILSGGQAPGGHNVIAGLFDALKAVNADSQLYGFLGGPSGLIDNKYLLLTEELIAQYRNTGGFDMICSGRTKLETEEQFAQVSKNCQKHGINAIVIIGGDDSNTNACALAQYMLSNKTGIQVIGCPKTIDGDLKNQWIEVSFGFDTATKVYSELIGNIMRDANSSRKYWHFIKLMGRSASHIALECALQTHPNVCIISEEIADKRISLDQIVTELCELIIKRSERGNDFGIVLIPEGLIEFIPEMNKLIAQLNDLLSLQKDNFERLPDMTAKMSFVAERLEPDSAEVFNNLPSLIRAQLLDDRDPHGNVQVSRIETEKLLISMVEEKLAKSKNKVKFTGLAHFFGYEGRCASPSNFDANYCYSLGYTAAALIAAGKTGYMASVRNIAKPADEWTAGGIPLTMMMNMEQRHGKSVPVIRKALVELGAKPFQTFAAQRKNWGIETSFVYPGPIQYFGPAEVCDQPSITLKLEHQ